MSCADFAAFLFTDTKKKGCLQPLRCPIGELATPGTSGPRLQAAPSFSGEQRTHLTKELHFDPKEPEHQKRMNEQGWGRPRK